MSQLAQTDREEAKFFRPQATLFAQRYQPTVFPDGDGKNGAAFQIFQGSCGIHIKRIRRHHRRRRFDQCSGSAQLLLCRLQQLRCYGERWAFGCRNSPAQPFATRRIYCSLFVDPKAHSRSQFLIPLLLRLQMSIEFKQGLSGFPRIELVGRLASFKRWSLNPQAEVGGNVVDNVGAYTSHLPGISRDQRIFADRIDQSWKALRVLIHSGDGFWGKQELWDTDIPPAAAGARCIPWSPPNSKVQDGSAGRFSASIAAS